MKDGDLYPINFFCNFRVFNFLIFTQIHERESKGEWKETAKEREKSVSQYLLTMTAPWTPLPLKFGAYSDRSIVLSHSITLWLVHKTTSPGIPFMWGCCAHKNMPEMTKKIKQVYVNTNQTSHADNDYTENVNKIRHLYRQKQYTEYYNYK